MGSGYIDKKGTKMDPCSKRTILCLDCINVDILVMMSHYSFEDVISTKTG